MDHSTLWRLFYSNSIFDLQLDGDIATIGITAHAADALGDIVFVDLPAEGAEFDKGDSFGAVESVKAASDVYSPISGEVVAINEDLADSPGKVNEGAYTDGWMMKVKMSTPAELDSLMDAAQYEAACDQ